MKVKQPLVVSTALACLLAGCATPMTPEEKKVASQVAGGVTGAAIG